MKKKFRFPRGIHTVVFPAMPPVGAVYLEGLAQKTIKETVAHFSSLPKNAHTSFEYRYSDESSGMEVKISRF